MLYSSAADNVIQMEPQIHILQFCQLDSLLNYPADFVVNWIQVMAVWWPQIWDDE